MRRLLPVLLTLVTAAAVASADPRPRDIMDGAQLRLALRKLQVMGSALYVGAHPDDENTAFLAYLSRGRMVRAAYLSMTRGDGGQNLIGLEIGEQLGVIRTQELLAGRRIDGAEQFFTRALDFGFSKNPEETLRIWGHDRVLADVVWVIRRFQPDVIVTRFGTDGSGGHGHHTASAMLAEEAFRAAADSTRFPEQLRLVRPWQARRILWNNWAPKLEGRDPKLPPVLSLDLGSYSALIGRSWTEIASVSRSMHKSQGDGALERRGPAPNWLEHREGEPARQDLFDGVDLSWSRIPGGERVGTLLQQAESAFDPDHPDAILTTLLAAHVAMSKLPDGPLVEVKRRELLDVIRSCTGLWMEAVATAPEVSPGSKLTLRLSVLNRSRSPLTLERIELPYGAVARLAAESKADSGARPEVAHRSLELNRATVANAEIRLPADLPLTQPYWLRRPALAGSFEVEDAALIGEPENPPALTARVVIEVSGERLDYELPVVYRWVDPVLAERWRPLAIVPPASLRFDQGVYLFSSLQPREVRLVVQSSGDSVAGSARLRLPAGWSASPALAPVRLSSGGEQVVRFMVKPAVLRATATLSAEIEIGGRVWAQRLVRIDHSHIPIQVLFPPAEAKLVRVEVKHFGESIAYLMGSGDQVPDAMRQMGFRVTLLSDEEVENTDLTHFNAIVAGVRAYNTRPRLRALEPRLLDYVAKGGRLLVQYNTADDALNDRLGPWPFKISRDRVTVEDAEMRMLAPAHPLFNQPNRITRDDFSGWVQERGLNYAGPWDARYQTVLSANDPGETPKDGGLIYARYGKGVFIYTGLAWFRQLPAGVSGAWRLFANLVSAAAR